MAAGGRGVQDRRPFHAGPGAAGRKPPVYHGPGQGCRGSPQAHGAGRCRFVLERLRRPPRSARARGPPPDRRTGRRNGARMARARLRCGRIRGQPGGVADGHRQPEHGRAGPTEVRGTGSGGHVRESPRPGKPPRPLQVWRRPYRGIDQPGQDPQRLGVHRPAGEARELPDGRNAGRGHRQPGPGLRACSRP